MLLSLLISMAFAADPEPVAPTPTPPIDKEFSAKELTINGVVIGKSNLYNAVGKFGTNMFHKDGATAVVCWNGEDGTRLQFNSDPSAGAKDNSITTVILVADGEPLDGESSCKPSKKVSASLEVVGISIADSVETIEKKLGAPSEKTSTEMVWNYLHGNPAKGVESKVIVEVSAANKVTSMSLRRAQHTCARGSSCGGSAH